jgi:hypothetical protein
MPLGYISIYTQVMLWEFFKYATEMLCVTCLWSFFNVWWMLTKEKFIVSLKNYKKEKNVQFPVI